MTFRKKTNQKKQLIVCKVPDDFLLEFVASSRSFRAPTSYTKIASTMPGSGRHPFPKTRRIAGGHASRLPTCCATLTSKTNKITTVGTNTVDGSRRERYSRCSATFPRTAAIGHVSVDYSRGSSLAGKLRTWPAATLACAARGGGAR